MKKITLNEDHIALIKNIRFDEFEFDGTDMENDSVNTIRRFGWGIDQYNIFGGTFVMEDIALILGKFDQFVEGSEEDNLGRKYPDELEDYWWDLYRYLINNMKYIIDLVFWAALNNEALTAGTYKQMNKARIWEKEN